MGHERIGVLPKTRRWRDLVHEISSYSGASNYSSIVLTQTIRNVNVQFKEVPKDSGVFAAFKFLVLISAISGKSDSPAIDLANAGIDVGNTPTPLTISCELSKVVTLAAKSGSLEYGEIARQAAIDAISSQYKDNKYKQVPLFDVPIDAYEVWKKAGTGAGFCELARCFFAKYTERYMKYFIEREASSVINNIDDRESFSQQIELHIDKISRHSFETARITQSFAAGWFNKYTAKGIPSDLAIRYMLRRSFAKLREELRREEGNI